MQPADIPYEEPHTPVCQRGSRRRECVRFEEGTKLVLWCKGLPCVSCQSKHVSTIDSQPQLDRHPDVRRMKKAYNIGQGNFVHC